METEGTSLLDYNSQGRKEREGERDRENGNKGSHWNTVDKINQKQVLHKGEVIAEQEKQTKNSICERVQRVVVPFASFPLTQKVCYKVENVQ
jgi:hypothetical protein